MKTFTFPTRDTTRDHTAKGSKSMKNRSALVAGGILAALTLGFQGIASAQTVETKGWPTGCTYQSNLNNGAMARCSNSHGGHYRASVLCTRLDGGGIVDVEAVAWRTSGWSHVYCPPLTQYKSAGIVTKST